jgi:hypothetical protein
VRQRTTTYGVVAGIYGIMRIGQNSIRKEFYVLPEGPVGSFATVGDSGALVATNNGEAVRVVLGGYLRLRLGRQFCSQTRNYCRIFQAGYITGGQTGLLARLHYLRQYSTNS